MPHADPNTRVPPQGDRETRTLAGRCRDFVDLHPRTGWYIAALSLLNVALNLLDLLK